MIRDSAVLMFFSFSANLQLHFYRADFEAINVATAKKKDRTQHQQQQNRVSADQSL